MTTTDICQHCILPTIFVCFFTPIVQVLSWTACHLKAPLGVHNFIGDAFSWKFVLVSLCWSYAFLRFPGAIHHGQVTDYGQIPVYRANGLIYYLCTLIVFVLLEYWLTPGVSILVLRSMPAVLASLNCVAILLCVILVARGKLAPQSSEKIAPAPLVHEFYRGMELHPRICGVDVKQWTNCRMGMMLWQVLILTFFCGAWRERGFCFAHAVCVGLQSVYIAKFFAWECGYFATLDMTMDRAGYYLCWGCLVWVPGFYTLTAFVLAENPPQATEWQAILLLIIGVLSIALNYSVDRQKQTFRNAVDGRVYVWGRPATFITASYRRHNGETAHTRLLTLGWWGIARHLNYTFELVAALSWCSLGSGLGLMPFLYFFFLLVLLLHRVRRDELKCASKYGQAWCDYRCQVSAAMIPYVY